MDPISYHTDTTYPTDVTDPTYPTCPTFHADSACPDSGCCTDPACPISCADPYCFACHAEPTYPTDVTDVSYRTGSTNPTYSTNATGSTYPIDPTYPTAARDSLTMDPIPSYADPTDPRVHPPNSTDLTNPEGFTASVHSRWNPIVPSEPVTPPAISQRASVGTTSSEGPDSDDIRSRSNSISSVASSLSGDVSSDAGSAAPTIAYPYPRLPIEVCEFIIEFIEDKDTLLECCLTCQDWHPKSRIGLDRHTTVLEIGGHDSISAAIERIKSRRITGGQCPGVQKIEIYFDSNQGSELSLMAFQLPSRLPNLQKVTLNRTDMRSVHPRFYTALTLFRNVHTLELWKPDFSTYNQLFSVVAAFRNLTSLYLSRLPDTAPLDGRILSQKPVIPDLELHYCDGHFPVLLRWVPPCATSLKIHDSWSSDDSRAIADYIQRCGGSLTHLKLGDADSADGCEWLGDFNFAYNTNLRSLALTYLDDDPDDADPSNGWSWNNLQPVARMLATVSSECLEDLDVTLILDLHPLPDVVVLPDPGWDAIDSVFALPNFPHVKRIHITMLVAVWSPGHSVSSASMAQLLPRLASRAAADFTTMLGRKVMDLNFSSSGSDSRPESSHSESVDSD